MRMIFIIQLYNIIFLVKSYICYFERNIFFTAGLVEAHVPIPSDTPVRQIGGRHEPGNYRHIWYKLNLINRSIKLDFPKNTDLLKEPFLY